MEKRALHEVIRRAARNSYILQKTAERRRERARSIVKAAASAALRREDLKGAILSVVNGGKYAVPKVKLPEVGKALGHMFQGAGKGVQGFGKRLSRFGLFGLIGRGARNILGRNIGTAGSPMARRTGLLGFKDRFTGRELSNFLKATGTPETAEARKAVIDAGRRDLAGLSRAERNVHYKNDLDELAHIAKEKGKESLSTIATSGGDSPGARAQRAIAAKLRDEMWRARRNVALAGVAGAGGIGGLAYSGSLDSGDPYKY